MENNKRQSIIINSCHGYDACWLFSIRYAPRHKQLSTVFASTEENQDFPFAYRLLACSPAFKYTNPSCSACLCNAVFVTTHIYTRVFQKLKSLQSRQRVLSGVNLQGRRHVICSDKSHEKRQFQSAQLRWKLNYCTDAMGCRSVPQSLLFLHSAIVTIWYQLLTISSYIFSEIWQLWRAYELLHSVFHILALKDVLIHQQTHIYKYVQSLYYTGVLISP